MNPLPDTAELRSEVFRAAQDYHGALADYCHAMAEARDIETPAQVLFGRGLFYYLALSRLLARENTQRLAERLRYLRTSQFTLARRYALVKQFSR